MYSLNRPSAIGIPGDLLFNCLKIIQISFQLCRSARVLQSSQSSARGILPILERHTLGPVW